MRQKLFENPSEQCMGRPRGPQNVQEAIRVSPFQCRLGVSDARSGWDLDE